ncbi:hypothetical protein JXA47_01245, partial [Candidatus Sumerlaeota bacterium]|nr:hypothetical protein [Candidatus Sumerlaeota bacterium]
LIPKAGVSFRFRRVRFPVIWVTAVVCPAVALVLYYLFREEAGWTSGEPFPWGLLPAVALGLNLALPLVHRLSGFHPATAELQLRGWSFGRRDDVLQILIDHLHALGLTIEGAERWGCDLAARGMVKGTIEATKRIPYMVFVKMTPETYGTGLSLRVDNMDIVIRDTGESKNCEILLRAVVARLEQPPFTDTPEASVDLSV